jgi:hypothetical protein
VLPQVIPSSHNSLFATNYTILMSVTSNLTKRNKMADKDEFSIDDHVMILGIRGYVGCLNGADGTVYGKDEARYSVVLWDGTCLNIAAKNLVLAPPRRRDENRVTPLLMTNPSKKERSLEFHRNISEIYQTIRNKDGSHTSGLKTIGTFSSTMPCIKLVSDDYIMMMYAVMEYFKCFSGQYLSETELVLEWTIPCMVLNRKPKKKYSKSQLKEMRQKIFAAHAGFLSFKLQKEKKIEEQIKKEEKVDEQMSRNYSLVQEIQDIIFDELLPEDLNSTRKILSDPVLTKGLKLEVVEDESDPDKHVTTFRFTDNGNGKECAASKTEVGDNDDDKECAEVATLTVELEKSKSISLKPTSSRVLEELTRKMHFQEGPDDDDDDDDDDYSKPAWPSADKEYTAKMDPGTAKTLGDNIDTTERDAFINAVISRTVNGEVMSDAFINAVISRIDGSHCGVDVDGKRDIDEVKDIPRTRTDDDNDPDELDDDELDDDDYDDDDDDYDDDDDDDDDDYDDDDYDDDDPDDDDRVFKEFKTPEKRRVNKYGVPIYNL